MLNNPLIYTDLNGEWFGLDDALAFIIGGTINLVSNALQGNIDSWGDGFAAFAAGGVAGTLSLYGPLGWVAGGAILGATNAHLAGTDILTGALTGAAYSLIGGQFGKWAGKLGGVAINGIKTKSPLLKGIIRGSIGGGAGGYATGFSLSLISGSNIEEALSAGWQSAKMGFAIGGIAGGGSAYAYAKANNINPWNGKSLGYKSGELNYKYAKRLQKNKADFFKDRSYTEKVNLDIIKGDNHAFPESVKGFQYDGVIKNIQGRNGIFQMLEIRGNYHGSTGFFQFMLDNSGNINHRFFLKIYK